MSLLFIDERLLGTITQCLEVLHRLATVCVNLSDTRGRFETTEKVNKQVPLYYGKI